MRAVVVGNGQSPKGHGDLIDCHDVVMRVNGWWLTHPPPVAGRKITHWAWNTALYLVGLREEGEKNKIPKARAPRGQKYLICAENIRGKGKHVTNAKTASAALGKLPIAWMDKRADSRLAKALRQRAGRKVMPSTGIRGLNRIVALKPHHLTIIGFDATTPDKPGWNDLGNPWRKTHGLHNFTAEKQLIADLEDGRVWLGQPVNFSIDWVGRPAEL